MKSECAEPAADVLAWCRSALGPSAVIADTSKTHGGHESSTMRIRAPRGYHYLKIHQSREHWENEVHAYEQWSHSFGELAPRLIGVREEAPLALIISELPGRPLDAASLPRRTEQSVWRRAGAALVALHELAAGESFGPCRRDGTAAAAHPAHSAVEDVSARLTAQLDEGLQVGSIDDRERETIEAAREAVDVFEGEPPIPCHRDYCAPNWLVSEERELTGIIDFEFAYWDVRVSDFSRDPDWAWLRRPDLVEAFFEGYGQPLTPREEKQLLIARVDYALSAVLWGRRHSFHGFEWEGHQSLQRLADYFLH